MKTGSKTTLNLIEKTMLNLAIPRGCDAWNNILINANEAADIMNKDELVKYVEEYEESLPNSYFEVAHV